MKEPVNQLTPEAFRALARLRKAVDSRDAYVKVETDDGEGIPDSYRDFDAAIADYNETIADCAEALMDALTDTE